METAAPRAAAAERIRLETGAHLARRATPDPAIEAGSGEGRRRRRRQLAHVPTSSHAKARAELNLLTVNKVNKG